jgi:hypothetical protein
MLQILPSPFAWNWKKKIQNFVSFYNFMEEESIFVLELSFSAFNIKKIYGVIYIYLFIWDMKKNS